MPQRIEIGLDISEMRREILERQHEAMRPFQEELRKLDVIQEMMQKNASPVSPSVELAMRPQTAYERYLATGARGRKGKRQGLRTKPNGHANGHANGFDSRNRYEGMSQKAAVKNVLAEKAGLNCNQLVILLKQGGYPFTSAQPKQSLGTALRYMVKNGELQAVEPPEGHRNDGITYYLPEAK
jgi:hypothetical protein